MSNNGFLLVLNSGSSSVKFALYEQDGKECVGRGAIKNIGKNASMSVSGTFFVDKPHIMPTFSRECRTTTNATHALMKWLEQCLPSEQLVAVGHRVVHGGHIEEPCLVTPDIIAYLETLVPLAPLHQPFNLEAIDLITRLHPNVPQVVCLDTSFHTTIPPLHQRFALPRKWHDEGVKRYGFHGLSYEYIAGCLKEKSPRASRGRTIVAHLGGGASLCALQEGKSFETSMGFSALDGLVMGTRPGTLDAGVLLYFLQEKNMDEAAIEHMLYHDAGLLGVSGISSDMATLLDSQVSSAREAVDLFCLRITREAGALISLLAGLDAFIFTAGIGEHAPVIREKICSSLAWIGLELDLTKNSQAHGDQAVMLSKPLSKVDVWLIPTDEEQVIARHTSALIG